MKIFNRNCFIFIIFLFLTFFSGCSVQGKYKVLSFFFDEVPEPDQKEMQVALDTLQKDTLMLEGAIQIPKKPKLMFHEPYQQHECALCHDQELMGKFTMNQPDLCYQCHEDFKYIYNNLHGPVSGGYCTSCHSPHQSKQEKLLKREGDNICFYCHDQELIVKNDFHMDIEQNQCLTCHNPHGEEGPQMLRAGVCKTCHGDYKEEYKFLHNPVAAGLCSACHDSHQSEAKAKLLTSGQDLCLKCHDRKIVFKSETHADIGDAECTECHNPHGGEDKYIFY